MSKKLLFLIPVFLFLLALPLSSAVLTDSLVSLSFDNSSSYLHNDGSFNASFSNVGTTRTFVSGSNYAADFESGDGDYISFGNYPIFGNYTSSRSASLWFKAESLTSGDYLFRQKDTEGRWSINYDGTDIVCDVYDGVIYKKAVKTAPSTGVWTHVVCVYNGSSVKLFMDDDGSPSTTAVTSSPYSSDKIFSIGSIEGGVSNYFDGLMDQYMVYDRALSSSEVTTLYNSGVIYNTYNPPAKPPINDSTESTGLTKQSGSVTFTGGTTTVLAGTFNISKDYEPYYGSYSFNVLSAGANTIYCEALIDGSVVDEVSRTNVLGQLGSVYLQTNVLTNLTNGTHTRELRCLRSAGGGSITVTNTIGVGHFLIDQDNDFIRYNDSESNTTVTSGSTYSIVDSIDIFTSNKTETENVTVNRTQHLVIEGSFEYTNNDVSTETLGLYANVNGTNCTFLPRTVSPSGIGSVSYDCILHNVTPNSLYTVNIYGNGTNAFYHGDTVVKNFFLDYREIIGGSGILTGYSFSDDVDTLIINVTGGNINHDYSNIFTKLSYSLSTNKSTTANFYIKLINGENFSTINFSRYLAIGSTGVLIGQDVFENLPKDDYDVLLYGNCGTDGATCTINGGQSSGYITDVIPVLNRGFNITAYNFYTNESILTFNVTDSFGTTISTTNGVISIVTNLSTEDYVIRAYYNGTNYFGRTITNHDTNDNLNVTMYPGVITIESPDNNTYVNTMPSFSFSYVNGVWKGLTCLYYDNRNGSFVSYDSRSSVGPSVVTTFLSVPVFPDSNNYSFYYTCENDEYQSLTYNVIYDVTDPVITLTNPSPTNNSFFNTNFTLNITITDINNYDALINITNPSGVSIFYKEYNTSGITNYNISNIVNLSDPGKHELFIEAADGHTSKYITTFNTNYIPDGVRFNKELEIYSYNNDYSVTPIKLTDRYSIVFEPEEETWLETQYEALAGHVTVPKELGDPDVFIVHIEDGEISIVQDSNYVGHIVVKKGKNYHDWYWVDFENDEEAPVFLWQYDSQTVEVYVYGNEDTTYHFNSVGRLNVVNKTVEFYYDTSDISLAATYEPDLVTGFSTNYLLAATFNPARYTLTQNKTVTIDIGGTLYDAIANGSSINTFYYYYPYSVPFDYSSSTLTHQWYLDTIDNTNASVSTTTGPLTQNVFQVMIGSCNASLSYPLINFSYYDEKTGDSITADMNYELNFFDGTYTYPASGYFSSHSSDSICTNLNPANVTYNFAVNGLVTLSNVDDNYTTRVFTFSSDDPLLASNDDPLYQNLYLVKLADSQTVEYSWLSSNYELLDGVMRIYRCYSNNTKEMVESALITGGKSTANIELLTGVYSYDVVVDGRVYDEETYNVCHIESSQTVTYYVTLSQEALTPVSGLLFVGCSLSGPDNDSVVTMTWNDNSYDSSTITACLTGTRRAASNYVQVFEQCSVLDTGSLSVIVPDNNNEYIVRGYLIQGDNKGYCTDVITVGDDESAGDVFGMTGLWIVILFVLAIGLYYSDNGEMSLVGSAFAILLSWIVGFIAFGWLGTISIVLYLLIIVFISRGNKKK